jgi:hypothetical protein
MKTWLYRGCPACHGDLQWDPNEREYHCFACARTFPLVWSAAERIPEANVLAGPQGTQREPEPHGRYKPQVRQYPERLSHHADPIDL